jgi:uncharacterized protein with PIN domain
MTTDVTADISRKLTGGNLEERVDALDILTHALEFTKPPDALDIWRLALHQRQVSVQATAALEALVQFLIEQYAKGNHAAAAEICDCLSYIGPAADSVQGGA